jgi:hypothetical protein
MTRLKPCNAIDCCTQNITRHIAQWSWRYEFIGEFLLTSHVVTAEQNLQDRQEKGHSCPARPYSIPRQYVYRAPAIFHGRGNMLVHAIKPLDYSANDLGISDRSW